MPSCNLNASHYVHGIKILITNIFRKHQRNKYIKLYKQLTVMTLGLPAKHKSPVKYEIRISNSNTGMYSKLIFIRNSNNWGFYLLFPYLAILCGLLCMRYLPIFIFFPPVKTLIFNSSLESRVFTCFRT